MATKSKAKQTQTKSVAVSKGKINRAVKDLEAISEVVAVEGAITAIEGTEKLEVAQAMNQAGTAMGAASLARRLRQRLSS